METPDLIPITGTPLNRLFFAINHYVSTGDHIGEGIAYELSPQRRRLVIPVNPRNRVDVEDKQALRARMKELYGIAPARFLGPLSQRSGIFELYYMDIDLGDMDRMADLLMEKPGPKGWGSMKKTIDQYTWTNE